MLLVKTKLNRSLIEGIGCFADEFIAKGTQVWKFQEGFDLKIYSSEIDKLSEAGKLQFLKYAYKTKDDIYVLCFDDGRFFNHADNPNLIEIDDGDEGINIATRDIQKGEELTCDYRFFDKDADKKLGI